MEISKRFRVQQQNPNRTVKSLIFLTNFPFLYSRLFQSVACRRRRHQARDISERKNDIIHFINIGRGFC